MLDQMEEILDTTLSVGEPWLSDSKDHELKGTLHVRLSLVACGT
jgi:hypothetical protein